jgi:hypothetical protein
MCKSAPEKRNCSEAERRSKLTPACMVLFCNAKSPNTCQRFRRQAVGVRHVILTCGLPRFPRPHWNISSHSGESSLGFATTTKMFVSIEEHDYIYSRTPWTLEEIQNWVFL